MKIFLISLLIVDSIVVGDLIPGGKLFRFSPDDSIYNCYRSPANENFAKFINIDNILLDQIDEHDFEIGGEIKIVHNFNAEPIHVVIKSKYLSKGAWVDGILRYYTMNVCDDFGRPESPWYNITKNWSKSQCPPHKGDIWTIDQQSIGLTVFLPQRMPIGPWLASFIVSQGEKNKFCFTMRFDLFPNE